MQQPRSERADGSHFFLLQHVAFDLGKALVGLFQLSIFLATSVLSLNNIRRVRSLK